MKINMLKNLLVYISTIVLVVVFVVTLTTCWYLAPRNIAQWINQQEIQEIVFVEWHPRYSFVDGVRVRNEEKSFDTYSIKKDNSNFEIIAREVSSISYTYQPGNVAYALLVNSLNNIVIILKDGSYLRLIEMSEIRKYSSDNILLKSEYVKTCSMKGYSQVFNWRLAGDFETYTALPEYFWQIDQFGM